MATIGTFTAQGDGYTGSIKTLTLNVKATIKPCDRDNDKAPDYRVTANGVEFGAGWSRTARETGAEYLSLKLDDPSFTAPVYASLVQGDKGEHKLIWSRGLANGAPLTAGRPPSKPRNYVEQNPPKPAENQASRANAPHNPDLRAAWQKVSEQTGREYLSVKLDDPSFPAAIYATLTEVDGEDGFHLIWSRPNRD